MNARSRTTRIAAAAVAIASVLGTPTAADAVGLWSYAGPTTVIRTCGFDPGIGTAIPEVSTGSFAGVFRPDSTRNVRVGETFALAVDVQNVSSCDDAAVVPALKLPAASSSPQWHDP